MNLQSPDQGTSSLNVPHKVHHFVTGKTLIMFVTFVATVGIAVGSYMYLLNRIPFMSPSEKKVATPSTKKTATFADPHEYSDDSLSFFYPGSMVIDMTSEGMISWKIKSSADTYMTKAIVLKKQTTPFIAPQNGDDNHTPTQYFSIDDTQARYINNLTVKEYTVNCGIDCDYRIDQFAIGATYYQLYFDTSRAGFSTQTEQILATLRKVAAAPSPTCRPRPACLDTTPRCMIPETEDMCPRATSIPSANDQILCTQEAKMCSDGSYVSRQGPNCEFAACPTSRIKN